MHPLGSLWYFFYRVSQRMRATDLVVPIGADHQQVPNFGMRHKMFEEVQRCCVQPLQIIDEQRERVLLAREHGKKASEHHLEAVLCVSQRQVRDRRLFTNNELQLRNQIDDELTIQSKRAAKGFAPPAKLFLALGEDRAHEALEGLADGRVRDVALVLVELAG